MKNIPIFYHLERSCNKSLYLNEDLSFTALRRNFSANSKGTCALCLHNSRVCLGCIEVPGHCCMPCRHEEENWEQCRLKMVFSYVEYVTYPKSEAAGI